MYDKKKLEPLLFVKTLVLLHQGVVLGANAAIALLLLSVAVFNFIGFDNALTYS
jgi:hypothetical protein